MMLKPDQERVRTLLRDTITLLCKNGLSFKTKFSIDAVIGVTLDEADAFYVSMNQVVAADKPVLEQDESNSSGDETEALYKQKRKRRGTRHKQSKQIKVEDKQTISIPEDSQHNDMVEQFDDSEGDNLEDASNLSGTFKVEIDESNKDIVFIKQEIEHGESWQEAVRGSTSFQASDSNYSGLDTSQDGGRNWMQGSQQTNLEQSPTTSAALGTSQQLSHVQPVMGSILKSYKRKPRHISEESTNVIGEYLCQKCGKTYKSRRGLIDHQAQVHEQISKYSCNICKKLFQNKTKHTSHMLGHSGIKGYKCDQCSKSYAHKKDLNCHIDRVHLGRRVKCLACEKDFNSKAAMTVHMNGIHSKTHYKCQFCSKSISFKPNLIRHERICKKMNIVSDNLNTDVELLDVSVVSS